MVTILCGHRNYLYGNVIRTDIVQENRIKFVINHNHVNYYKKLHTISKCFNFTGK